ncbi:MAG: hypothetical protein M3P08_18395 [Thermoproteota archaeon]|nr:hypothetical protein [Thermoproteota archaeon]
MYNDCPSVIVVRRPLSNRFIELASILCVALSSCNFLVIHPNNNLAQQQYKHPNNNMGASVLTFRLAKLDDKKTCN